MEVKKNPGADLSRYSLFFFQLGIILMLFVTWQAIEWKSVDRGDVSSMLVDSNESLEELIPITERLDIPPPPPPPPAVSATILVEVENESDVEESIIESTETSQNADIEIVEIAEIKVVEAEEEEIADIPFAVIENVPVYPGCENAPDNESKKRCMSEKVQKFVLDNFNTALASELGLEGRQRIFVTFRINKFGDVDDVRARAPHASLEKEAIKIVKSLPHMTPGKQRGVPVGVSYGLPIIFQIEL
jgi:protein TonB